MRLRVALVLCMALAVAGLVRPAAAQTSLADLLGRTATPEGQAKSLLEEMSLYGYLENS